MFKNFGAYLLKVFKKLIIDLLFNSTPDRKFIGFQIFCNILPKLNADLIPFVFSKNFLRCLINNLSDKKSYLHKVARFAIGTLIKVAEEKKEVSFQIVLQLVGSNGHFNFDEITKTNLVGSLLGSLTSDGILDYSNYLFGIFLDQSNNE